MAVAVVGQRARGAAVDGQGPGGEARGFLPVHGGAEAADRLTITPEEAAQALGVSRSTVYEGLLRGEIPGFRIGRRWVISYRAFAEWFERMSAANVRGRAAGDAVAR